MNFLLAIGIDSYYPYQQPKLTTIKILPAEKSQFISSFYMRLGNCRLPKITFYN